MGDTKDRITVLEQTRSIPGTANKPFSFMLAGHHRWMFQEIEESDGLAFLDAYGQVPPYDEVLEFIAAIQQFYIDMSLASDCSIADLHNHMEFVEEEKPKKKESAVTKKKASPGYVYCVRVGDYYKIGVSGNPEARYKQIKTGSPHKVIEIAKKFFNNPYGVEAGLHEGLKGYRKEGEWFDLKEDWQIDHVKMVLGES